MGLKILDIASLWATFSKSFYTEPLMIVLNILFILVAVKYQPGKYRFLIFYGLAALLQDIIGITATVTELASFNSGMFGATLATSSIIIFVQIEFIVFFKFFYIEFSGRPFQYKIKIAGIIYVVLGILFSIYFIPFASFNNMHKFANYLCVTSSIIQLIPAFYYFYTLFKEPPVKNLLREKSFWICTGIAFLHGLNIPLYLMENYLLQRYSLIWYNFYTINFIAYSFLFTLFIISILCDKTSNPNDFYKQSFVKCNKT